MRAAFFFVPQGPKRGSNSPEESLMILEFKIRWPKVTWSSTKHYSTTFPPLIVPDRPSYRRPGQVLIFKLFKLPAHATHAALATLATLWFFDLPGSETVFVGCHSHTTQCTWGLAESAVYISPSTGSLPFLPNNTFWEKCRAARCFDSFCVEKSLFSARKLTRSYMVLDWFWDRCKLFLQENTMGHQVSFEPDLFLIFASQKLSHSET